MLNSTKVSNPLNASTLDTVRKAAILTEALPYIQRFRNSIFVIKYGGSFMDEQDAEMQAKIATDIVLLATVGIRVVVVHGGGKAISRAVKNRASKFIQGFRVTDQETIKAVEQTLNYTVNPEICSLIEKRGGRPLSVLGESIFKCEKVALQNKEGEALELGYVGKITEVNTRVLNEALEQGYIPIVSPLAINETDELFNTNADVAAGMVARTLHARRLVYLSDVPGLLKDPNDPKSLIPTLPIAAVEPLKKSGVISQGMLPKVDSAIQALQKGTQRVHFIDARIPHSILLEIFTDQGIGTEIVLNPKQEPSVDRPVESDPLTLHESYLIKTYPPPPLTLVRGSGSYVWDDQGRRYLDFSTGIATNTLGHSHPDWIYKISQQAEALAHCSNLYNHRNQGVLAQRLVQRAGPGRLFFCNSGAEANEGLIKLARLHGVRQTGEQGRRFKILCAENAFHGRTFGGMSATHQQKIQNGFYPMLEGFAFGRFNDPQSFADLIDDQTAAIMLETIQGEGGIHVAEAPFLRKIRALCDAHGLLFILDEVQCGIGRTGTFFAYEHSGVCPDAVGMAKGLGGGFPIGALWVTEKYADLFTPGSHGSTFGGSPLACAAALAVIDTIENEDLLQKVTAQSKPWIQRLQGLVPKFSTKIEQVRGRGYMVGIKAKINNISIIAELREKGLLIPPAGGNVLRLLPPLNAKEEELNLAVDILETVLAEHSLTPKL